MDIFKENFYIKKKIPNNVINDLCKLCFQNYRASLITITITITNNLFRHMVQ